MQHSYEKVSHAEAVATLAHEGQLRKYTGEPYIEHPRAVVELVKQAKRCDDSMIAAAWLHDTLEDTQLRGHEVHDWFGPKVFKMVADLTNCDLEVGNRRERFRINMNRLSHSSGATQTVKVCDILHNTSTIVRDNPKFAGHYLAEKLEVLMLALTRADEALRQRAIEQCLALMLELELCQK